MHWKSIRNVVDFEVLSSMGFGTCYSFFVIQCVYNKASSLLGEYEMLSVRV